MSDIARIDLAAGPVAGEVTPERMTPDEQSALDATQTEATSAADAQAAEDANATILRTRAAQALANLEPAWNFSTLAQATRDAQRDQLVQLLVRCVARLIRLEASQLDQAP